MSMDSLGIRRSRRAAATRRWPSSSSK